MTGLLAPSDPRLRRISEGQNLQDCDWLVNYDIHWNPVRIIQRFGRIDPADSPAAGRSGAGKVAQQRRRRDRHVDILVGHLGK